MRITRETLIRIAKETAQKRALGDAGLVAAYLTGSLCSENPFLGYATDIDIILVHSSKPEIRREILPLTPEISLDIIHNPRSEYEKPKELRVHPWLGPELYDPLPLYGTQHFFEFVQAGVRAEYNDPVNVLARARRTMENARRIWSGLQLDQQTGPALLLSFLKAVNRAVNTIALLNGSPLAERRLLLQFQERAVAAGAAGLNAALLGLLGVSQTDEDTLRDFLKDWEITFLEAAKMEPGHASIKAPRLGYYKHSFEAMLETGFPHSILWPLIKTWTLAAAFLPPENIFKWHAACETLGLVGDAFDERIAGLDLFLDTVEELLEKQAAINGL